MFKLPSLPYSYDALEPVIDGSSVTRHYLDNHQGYVRKLNDIVAKNKSFQNQSLLDLSLTTQVGTPVNNNAAQAWAHQFWWESMCPVGTSRPPRELDLKSFHDEWVEKGKALFGSGWIWLVSSRDELQVVALPNAVLPQRYGVKPLLVMDLWEHAYYCQYGTNRADYLSKSVSILNWHRFAERAQK